MIKTCLFDMGKVLVNFSHEKMLKQMAELCLCEVELLRAYLFESQVLLDYERGAISDGEMHGAIQRLVKREVVQQELEYAASHIFSLNEPMLPLLDELKQEGLRLVLLSNTSGIHINYIRAHFNLLDRFEELVLSYEVGANKPSPEIYQAAIEAAQCSPEECFFTDDILINVEAARSHGIQAEQYLDPAQIREVIEREVLCRS